MKTKGAFLSTRESVLPAAHLEQVLPTMQASSSWNLGKPIVHVIDREADSIGHWRQWDAAGHKLLIRGDDRVARWEGRAIKLSEIRKELEDRGAFRDAGPALYHGRTARLRVAETTVVLDRPARTMIDGKQVSVPGPALTMRLILTRVEDSAGKLLASCISCRTSPPNGPTPPNSPAATTGGGASNRTSN